MFDTRLPGVAPMGSFCRQERSFESPATTVTLSEVFVLLLASTTRTAIEDPAATLTGYQVRLLVLSGCESKRRWSDPVAPSYRRMSTVLLPMEFSQRTCARLHWTGGEGVNPSALSGEDILVDETTGLES